MTHRQICILVRDCDYIDIQQAIGFREALAGVPSTFDEIHPSLLTGHLTAAICREWMAHRRKRLSDGEIDAMEDLSAEDVESVGPKTTTASPLGPSEPPPPRS